MPVVATTVFLDLSDVEDLILSYLVSWSINEGISGKPYEVWLADLIRDGIKPDGNGSRQCNERQQQWQSIVGYTLIMAFRHGDSWSPVVVVAREQRR